MCQPRWRTQRFPLPACGLFLRSRATFAAAVSASLFALFRLKEQLRKQAKELRKLRHFRDVQHTLHEETEQHIDVSSLLTGPELPKAAVIHKCPNLATANVATVCCFLFRAFRGCTRS